MTYTARFVPETTTRDALDAQRGLTVVEFGADWCAHCQAAQPAVESVLAAAAVNHIKVEDGKGRPLGRSYHVKLWPTLIFLKDGQEVARVVRPTEAAPLQAALRQLTGQGDA